MSGLDADLDYLLVEALSEAASLSGSSVRTSARLSSTSSATSAPASAVRGGGVGGGFESDGDTVGGRFSQGSVSLSKMYSVVRVSGGDDLICFGSVGTGNASFCIRKNCGVKAHADSKVSLMGIRSTRIFISRKVGSTVFVEPSVDFSKISSEVWEDWKHKQGSLAEWNQEFCAVEIADSESATIDEVKTESTFLSKASKDFKTPSKRSRDSMELMDDDEVPEAPLEKIDVQLHERTFPPIESVEWEELIGEKGIKKSMVTLALSQIESSVIALGKSMRSVVAHSQTRFVEIEKGSKLIAGAVHTLSSTVGSSVEIDNRFEAPTLWGTSAFITHELVRIGEVVADLETEVNPLKKEMVEKESASKESLTKMEESCRKTVKALVMIMNRVKEINPELATLKAKVEEVEDVQQRASKRSKHQQGREEVYGNFSNTGNHKDRERVDDSGVDDLMQLLGKNNLEVDAPINPTERTPTGQGQSASGGVNFNNLCESLAQTAAAVETLIEDVGILKLCIEDKSVKFGGLGLRTIHECNEWIQNHFSCYRYGLIMDPLLMLDRIFASREGASKTANQFKVWEARLKLKISTGAEGAAVNAVQINRPQLFHSGMTELAPGRNKSRLNMLPNVAAWKSAGEGVRPFIIKRMNSMHSTLLKEIAFAFGSDGNMAKANSLAVTSLNDTITFLTQLFNFVDSLYEKLHLDSKFTSEQAWGLTTQILDRICEELYEPKEGVIDAMQVEDPASVCCHVLWSSFRTHEVMAGYLEKDFVNHPSISAEYVKFLATNSGHDKVEKLQAQMSEVVEKLSKAVDESKKATAKADAASAKCSELGREVVSLTKRVKTLEDQRANR